MKNIGLDPLQQRICEARGWIKFPPLTATKPPVPYGQLQDAVLGTARQWGAAWTAAEMAERLEERYSVLKEAVLKAIYRLEKAKLVKRAGKREWREGSYSQMWQINPGVRRHDAALNARA